MARVKRKIDPSDIKVPPGYQVEVYAKDLTTPINVIFTPKGDMLVGDAGVATGNGRVLLQTHKGFKVIAEGFNPPLTGITYHDGLIYVAHRGYITTVTMGGTKTDIISGLPSWGDHHNNRVIFGPDGKMYFGQGTATNSGVVGPDNGWVPDHPFFHDYPGTNIRLTGENFYSENFLPAAPDDLALTGAYSPFGVANYPYERVKGVVQASGSILRANPDDPELELVAWGLRNPFRIMFDRMNRLYCANHGMDVRGSRPIANSPDEFYHIKPNCWYGWPDFTGGLPVTMPYFQPEGHPQPDFILAEHPMIPPKPLANFEPHAAIMGFDFSYNEEFGHCGDVFIAEFGAMDPRTTGGKMVDVGHQVSRIDITTGEITVFAANKSGLNASQDGGGGFERPIDVIFGPDDAMYVADFGLDEGNHGEKPDGEEHSDHGERQQGHEHAFHRKTGVIWKITRKK